MTRIRSGWAILVATLAVSGNLAASGITAAEVGYMGFTQATLNRNPGAFDQPYLLLNYLNAQDQHRLSASLKLENPGATAHNQQHQAGRQAAKVSARYQGNLASVPAQLWLQHFSMLSDALIENNLFMGLRRDGHWQGLGLGMGAGAHYSFGRSDFTDQHYADWSGMVTNIQLNWANRSTRLSLDWMGHFFRSDAHASTFGYTGTGQQLTLLAQRQLWPDWSVQGKLVGYKSLGANPNDGLEYSMGVNYQF
ncbi:outer membrane protein OmpK [Ferrimonas sp. SCSIO 43195]|uniref:outer membrane protein OmpK n=1 Tax=Ferrimonas sp. SCSIO 43195 TaxID=2822844 RepID=UPI00207631FC|nr:outer membrane protein OmpK [Ferrimonas sp. SCSIO 43195]USD37504.1 hypothetical protein J8Z22_21455 [Ferrimonas sp. SCSIO 43195]